MSTFRHPLDGEQGAGTELWPAAGLFHTTREAGALLRQLGVPAPCAGEEPSQALGDVEMGAPLLWAHGLRCSRRETRRIRTGP